MRLTAGHGRELPLLTPKGQSVITDCPFRRTSGGAQPHFVTRVFPHLVTREVFEVVLPCMTPPQA